MDLRAGGNRTSWFGRAQGSFDGTLRYTEKGSYLQSLELGEGDPLLGTFGALRLEDILSF